MSDAALDVLGKNLESLLSSIEWLRRSYDLCTDIGIKDDYTEDEFDRFENLTSRYARTTDLLIGKVLRSIDRVELMNSGSIIDAANGAEKRGIVESVSKLRDTGKYYLLNEDKELVFKQEYGYVPNKLIPPKDGFDDYVDLEIDGEGKITNWYENPSFEDFDQFKRLA
jgi:hypothetical protein